MTALLSLNLLANAIIQNYFQSSRCMYILSDSTDTFVYKGNISIINLRIISSSIDEKIIFRSYGCQTFIIQHSNAGAVLSDLEQKMKLQEDRFGFRKYLILPSLHTSTNFTRVLKLQIMQYILDILLIIPEEECSTECNSIFNISCTCSETFKLITHKYVGISANDEPVVLDWWFSKNQSFVNNNDLYPDKITNQHGRILRCATLNYKPYSIVENSPPIAIGSENSIAHEYAKRHNMTVQYTLDDDEWGTIYDNWTGSGILGNLATDKADIAYGSIERWEHEYIFLDFSKPTVRTGVTCLVPAPRLAAGWVTPILPFTLEMWIALACSFVITFAVTTILTAYLSLLKLRMKNKNANSKSNSKIHYKNIVRQSLLNIYRIFLDQPLSTSNEEVKNTFKYLFVVFLFGIYITLTYSSGLVTAMTLPRYEGAINVISDLTDSGLRWGATHESWIYTILKEERPLYITLLNTFVVAPGEDLMPLSKTDHFAFALERLPSGQYAVGNYITESAVKNLRLLRDDVYWEYSIFMLRKSSPLLESVDKMILDIFQTGIINFWEMKAAHIHMNLHVQNIIRYYATAKEEPRRGTIKLRWTHVEGTFAILAAGHVISTACFILEIFFKLKHQKQIWKSFKWITKLLKIKKESTIKKVRERFNLRKT